MPGNMSYDLTMLYSPLDGEQWQTYLFETFDNPVTQFKVYKQPIGDELQSEDVQDIFNNSIVHLIILSPAFLDTIRDNPSINLSQVLIPERTIGIYLGTRELEILNNQVLMSRLPFFKNWRKIQVDPVNVNVLGIVKEVMNHYDCIKKIIDFVRSQSVICPEFRLYPDKVYENDQKLLIVTSKEVPDKYEVKVKLKGQTETTHPTKRLNKYCFEFTAPGIYAKYRSVQLSVHLMCGEETKTLGSIQLPYQRKWDVLTEATNPQTLLSQVLGLDSQYELEELDKYLSSTFAALQTAQLEVVSNSLQNNRGKSSDLIPTLLHFAARFNLPKLCAAVLQLPAGQVALRMENKVGETPRKLAEKYHYRGVVSYLKSMEERVVERNDRVASPQASVELPDGQNPDDYVVVDTNSDDNDDYLPMDKANISIPKRTQEDVQKEAQRFLEDGTCWSPRKEQKSIIDGFKNGDLTCKEAKTRMEDLSNDLAANTLQNENRNQLQNQFKHKSPEKITIEKMPPIQQNRPQIPPKSPLFNRDSYPSNQGAKQIAVTAGNGTSPYQSTKSPVTPPRPSPRTTLKGGAKQRPPSFEAPKPPVDDSHRSPPPLPPRKR